MNNDFFITLAKLTFPIVTGSVTASLLLRTLHKRKAIKNRDLLQKALIANPDIQASAIPKAGPETLTIYLVSGSLGIYAAIITGILTMFLSLEYLEQLNWLPILFNLGILCIWMAITVAWKKTRATKKSPEKNLCGEKH